MELLQEETVTTKTTDQITTELEKKDLVKQEINHNIEIEMV
jgi:hypothetical protein